MAHFKNNWAFMETYKKSLFPGLSYVPGNTGLYRQHPLGKLVLLISFTIAVFGLPAPLPGLLLLALLLSAYQLSGLGLTFFWKKLRIILIFGIMILLVQIFFCHEGRLLWNYTILGFLNLEVWSGGVSNGFSMALRFINVIGSSYLFVATTDPNQLAYALMQAGLPYRQGFMLITALRFIPVFERELAQVRNAQMAKGIELGKISPGQFIRYIRYLLLPLVISTLSKVDHLTISMEGRAFGLYQSRSYRERQQFTRRDWLLVLGTPLFFLVFYLWLR